MLEALSFQAVFGSMLMFLVEWMTGQSLQLFPLDGNFVLTSALKRLKVLTSLTLSAEDEAVLSSSKALARTFAAAFAVTAPFVVYSVVLPRSELPPFSDFVSCQSFWESLTMLRDAVFVFQLAWVCVCFFFFLSRSTFS